MDWMEAKTKSGSFLTKSCGPALKITSFYVTPYSVSQWMSVGKGTDL